jgi:hypothetical protein
MSDDTPSSSAVDVRKLQQTIGAQRAMIDRLRSLCISQELRDAEILDTALATINEQLRAAGLRLVRITD